MMKLLKRKTYTSWIILTTLVMFYTVSSNAQQKLDLSGIWTVALDSLDEGQHKGWFDQKFDQQIHLPGTTDDAGLGVKNILKPALEKQQLSHLTRKNRYVGATWYTRSVNIPKNWNNKKIILHLERVLWRSQIWIDGIKVEQSAHSLVTPHEFDLTEYLKPGETHQLTLQIDNRKFFDISDYNMGHAYTDHTQIIWNGALGNLTLQAHDPVHISDLQVYPDLNNNTVKAYVKLKQPEGKVRHATLRAAVRPKDTQRDAWVLTEKVTINQKVQLYELTYKLPEKAKTWDEFTPNLYTFDIQLQTEKMVDERQTTFGFRDFKAYGNTFVLNGMPVFLRGTLECNIFPLTGYPPMDKASWVKVFKTAKTWGLNHIRFHSWCPPKAAFEAADEQGIYLQAELPIWALNVGHNHGVTEFLYEEAHRMIREYGNHPSFMLWALGNELQGDMRVLNRIVDSLKQMDNRHLYANTAYTFERGHGDRPEYNDDFLITQRTFDGWVRGQGVFNSEAPSFNTNYEASVKNIQVPVVTHEIGQYAVYPNLREIEKYTGVLDPLNFKAIKADLEHKGMIHQADDFLLSSGKLAALLYKEEIERALKTDGISGFQLLDLHDFPGQGTALVGLLDAFWDSKGIIQAQEFRQFNAPIVPLLQFEKATYRSNESFTGIIALSNYSNSSLQEQRIDWRISNRDTELTNGSFTIDAKQGFNDNLGKINFQFSNIQQPTKLTIHLALPGTAYANSWDVWVYPNTDKLNWGDVRYTRDVDSALALLAQGEKVLLNPDWKKTKGIEGKFVPVFWSPVHFPKQAGTMGLLTDPTHPLFNNFPTESYTNWQWWDLHINSTTMVIDSLEGGNTLIQMVDNFANNRKLALAIEGTVDQGKLLLISPDLHRDIDGKRYVAKSLLHSILQYMNSSDFRPKVIKNPEFIKNIMLPEQSQQKKSEANSIY